MSCLTRRGGLGCSRLGRSHLMFMFASHRYRHPTTGREIVHRLHWFQWIDANRWSSRATSLITISMLLICLYLLCFMTVISFCEYIPVENNPCANSAPSYPSIAEGKSKLWREHWRVNSNLGHEINTEGKFKLWREITKVNWNLGREYTR